MAVPAIVVIILSGCKGGSTSAPTATYSPLTAVFSDAPVAGLTYRTSSGAAGTTDAQGRFNYAAGDSVTFSVGGMILGTAVPRLTAAGNAAVTPADLGLGPITSKYVLTVGQLLGTLNSIAVAQNIEANQLNPSQPRPLASGMFTMPTDTSALMAPILAPFFPRGSTAQTTVYVTSITNWPTQLQNLAASGVASVTSAAASAVISVPTQADATLNLNQAANATSVIGTVWTGIANLGAGSPAGTFYFQPDGNMTGFISDPRRPPVNTTGFADGDILAGTWTGSSTSGAGVQFSLISSAGGNYTGTIADGAVIGTITGTPAFNLTKVTSSTTLTNSLYVGGWYGVYTPTGSMDVYGTGTPVYLILSPDGTFSGIMDGNQTITGTIGGIWTPTSGIGSGSFMLNPGTFSFNMASRTGLFSQGGVVVGSISFSRTGMLSMNYSLPGASFDLTPPLTLNVQISWPANTSSTVVSSFPLALNIYNGTTLIASGIQSEINPLGNGAPAYTMTDSISVPYPNGISSAYSYSLSSGQSGCTFTNGTGTVVDGQPASTYLTVQITCH